MEWRKAWKQTTTASPSGGPQYHLKCEGCGAAFCIEDDGVDAEVGGLVERGNVSPPMIASLNVATGPREGGNALIITGEALEVGTLVVKFADEPAVAVNNRTVTTANVSVPRATYALNVAERCYRLTLTITSGSLSVDEAVTTDAGSTGLIRLIDGNFYWIAFTNRSETLDEMVGTSVVGGGAGGTATIDAAMEVDLNVGEVVTGLSSGAFAVVRDLAPLVVKEPTAGFAPDELVRGDISGALVKLTSSPAYSGLVDVSVENEHGQRLTGASLPDAYTFA